MVAFHLWIDAKLKTILIVFAFSMPSICLRNYFNFYCAKLDSKACCIINMKQSPDRYK